MKLTIVLALGIVLAGALGATFINKDVEVINERATATTTVEVEVMEEVDVIDSAKAELERINTQLDEEEMKLIQEIDERKARLEKIRETRQSFQ